MKTRIGLVSLVLLGVFGWVGACTPQPPLPCPIASANPYFGLAGYATVYTLKSGSGACSTKEYETWGFQKYNEPGTTEVHIAARPGDLGSLIENGRTNTLADGDPNILGDFPAATGTDGYCAATYGDAHAHPAEQVFEAIPDSTGADGGVIPGEPELHVKYAWSDLKFITTPRVPGTAFVGELQYTEDGCTATYTAEGFWPEVHCDPTQTATGGGVDLPDGGMMEDIDCQAGVDFANNHALGSGINPDFKTVCDESLEVCVLGTRDRTTRAVTRISVDELTKL